MSYKLGLLLSLTFLMSILLLSGDLVNITIIKNTLHSLSLIVSYRLQSEYQISSETKKLIESYGATYTLESVGRNAFRIGETVTYYLRKDYAPFVLGREVMHVSVRRSAIIGYYTI